ncbi:hypothetical protein ANCCAN_20408 [Ancylostoma caninum]|uniref:Uncharacterized protein n=1 Tax=Ancylostoma caninum TaxID=29170 RepID=A0A368FNE6_ANCCA|nr:hypothetical protein ANCCAN_20408 [Ancylostoma caninum]
MLLQLDRWTLGPLRQLSHSMYTLSYFKETYKDWSNHSTCSSCVSMLRLAYRAEIPRIMLYEARLTPYMMKRFMKAVKCSQVKVVEFDFISCDITCDVEQFVHFLELSKTHRLVMGGCYTEGIFREQLQQDAFIKEIDAVVTSYWEYPYPKDASEFFTVDGLLGLLNTWRHSRGTDVNLYMKVSLPVKSEKDIMDYIRRDHDRDRIPDSHPVHRQGNRYIFRRSPSGKMMYVKYKDGFMLINREEKPS